jgi:hypothetical protein
VILPFPFLVRMHGREYRVSRAILLTLVEQGETLALPELRLVLWQSSDGRWWLRGTGSGNAGRPCGPFKSAARVVRAVVRRRRRGGRGP